jgi:hypothetical protein
MARGFDPVPIRPWATASRTLDVAKSNEIPFRKPTFRDLGPPAMSSVPSWLVVGVLGKLRRADVVSVAGPGWSVSPSGKQILGGSWVVLRMMPVR